MHDRFKKIVSHIENNPGMTLLISFEAVTFCGIVVNLANTLNKLNLVYASICLRDPNFDQRACAVVETINTIAGK